MHGHNNDNNNSNNKNQRHRAALLPLAALVALLAGEPACALDLKRSLSYAEGLSALVSHSGGPHAAPVYATDDALMPAEGHANRVSKALRLLHSRAGDAIYKRTEAAPPDERLLMTSRSGHGPAEAPSDAARALSEHYADARSDAQVIADACQGRASKTCAFAVRAALKQSSEDQARLARALRRKPEHVDARKLLYHKLFESAIGKMEERNLDSKLDAGLALAISKTPYGYMANQALNLAAKKM